MGETGSGFLFEMAFPMPSNKKEPGKAVLCPPQHGFSRKKALHKKRAHTKDETIINTPGATRLSFCYGTTLFRHELTPTSPAEAGHKVYFCTTLRFGDRGERERDGDRERGQSKNIYGSDGTQGQSANYNTYGSTSRHTARPSAEEKSPTANIRQGRSVSVF